MPSEPILMGKTPAKRSTPNEVHVVWLTAGLSCDGDSVSVTAAEQPSIEDLILGAIPGLPKVALHNPVLAYETATTSQSFFTRRKLGVKQMGGPPAANVTCLPAPGLWRRRRANGFESGGGGGSSNGDCRP